MDCRPIKASRPEKKVNFQNFVQRFYALQQRLNNNRKPNITIYIWNKNKFAYQKKLKVEASLLYGVPDYVIYLFLMQK